MEELKMIYTTDGGDFLVIKAILEKHLQETVPTGKEEEPAIECDTMYYAIDEGKSGGDKTCVVLYTKDKNGIITIQATKQFEPVSEQPQPPTDTTSIGLKPGEYMTDNFGNITTYEDEQKEKSKPLPTDKECKHEFYYECTKCSKCDETLAYKRPFMKTKIKEDSVQEVEISHKKEKDGVERYAPVWECPNCGFDVYHSNFCPDCGVKIKRTD